MVHKAAVEVVCRSGFFVRTEIGYLKRFCDRVGFSEEAIQMSDASAPVVHKHACPSKIYLELFSARIHKVIVQTIFMAGTGIVSVCCIA